jgi:hypothetical protein
LLGLSPAGCDDGNDIAVVSAPDEPRFSGAVEGLIWHLVWECEPATSPRSAPAGSTRFEVRPTADPARVELVDLDRGAGWAIADVVAPDQLEWEVAGPGGAVVSDLVLRDGVLIYDSIHVGDAAPPIEPRDCFGTATPSGLAL